VYKLPPPPLPQHDSLNMEDEVSVDDKAPPPSLPPPPSHHGSAAAHQSGACEWPTSSSLTARLRRLVTAYQRSYRQEQLKMEAEAKGDRRRRRCEQASKLKEIARQERQQRYAHTQVATATGDGRVGGWGVMNQEKTPRVGVLGGTRTLTLTRSNNSEL